MYSIYIKKVKQSVYLNSIIFGILLFLRQKAYHSFVGLRFWGEIWS